MRDFFTKSTLLFRRLTETCSIRWRNADPMTSRYRSNYICERKAIVCRLIRFCSFTVFFVRAPNPSTWFLEHCESPSYLLSVRCVGIGEREDTLRREIILMMACWLWKSLHSNSEERNGRLHRSFIMQAASLMKTSRYPTSIIIRAKAFPWDQIQISENQ